MKKIIKKTVGIMSFALIVMIFFMGITSAQLKTNDVFVKLVENKADLTGGTAIFDIKIPQAATIITKKGSLNEFTFEGIEAKGRPLLGFNTSILRNITNNITVWKTEKRQKTCYNLFNETGNTNPYNCTYEVRVKSWKWSTTEEFILTDLNNYSFIAGESYRIGILGNWKAGLGEQAIDWVPTFKINGVELKMSRWAWWNLSVNQKVAYEVNQTAGCDNCTINITINTSRLIAEGKLDSICQAMWWINPAEDAELLWDYYDSTNDTYGCNTSSTGTWVGGINLSTSNQTIYLYYDNVTSEWNNVTLGIFEPDYTIILHLDNVSRIDEDVSIYGHSGTSIGTEKVPGIHGSAIDLDESAVDEGIEMDFEATMNFTDEVMTAMAWVYDRNTGGDYRKYVVQGDSDDQSFYLDAGPGNIIRVLLWDDAAGFYGHSSNFTMPANTWVHLAMTYDGTFIRLYVNGTEYYIVSEASRTIMDADAPFRIGRWQAGANELDGMIDEVRISRAALSADEILAIYTHDVTPGAEELQDVIPTITMDSPENITYLTRIIDLNVSADEVIDEWWYEYNSNGTNITFTPNTTFLAGGVDGAKHLTVYANDSDGNENLTTQYFTTSSITTTDVYVFINSEDQADYILWDMINESFKFIINGVIIRCINSTDSVQGDCG